MKRSKMLQLITESIQEKIGGHYSSFDEHAEAALEACEKAGMRITYRVIGSNHENDLWNLALSDWDEEYEKK